MKISGGHVRKESVISLLELLDHGGMSDQSVVPNTTQAYFKYMAALVVS